jgi:iron complex outermembrane receptor protein
VYEFLLYLYLLQHPLTQGEPASPGTYEEEVIVTATRSGRRVEDEPLRIEVVPSEEVQEKIMMTPGDVSMLLSETNGLRVQMTSPSLGGANVRVQGLRGRYTQVLADGLPLFGQSGSFSLLQIPPMDLQQVEVIKGVASALYGTAAVGGVVNLVTRRPRDQPEREILVNRTSHGGTDAVVWLAEKLDARWGYSLIGGLHGQERSDLDDDGWIDLPFYRRGVVRPRLFWEDGRGKSVLFAFGATGEERSGGTMPGRTAPDGAPFTERLDTRRFDAGTVGRVATSNGLVVTFRGSAVWQAHDHTFGPAIERDAHRTWFTEASVSGTRGSHTWVAGTALQHDSYASEDVPRFDFTHVVPGLFAQDELTVTRWLTVAASGRLDVHNVYGTFLSPRVSALLRSGGPWTGRLSVGRGYFAPTPLTDETEGTGLAVVAPLRGVRAERADSVSADLTWAKRPLEITATVFQSRIEHPLQLRDAPESWPRVIVNADGPSRTRGSELIGRFHTDAPELDVILTHMYLWSTEEDPDFPSRRREVPLNPRHTGSLDVLGEVGPIRVGFEVFISGRQSIEENPYRTRGGAYVLWGSLVDWRIGRFRLFVNGENLSDVRQTSLEPLVRRTRASDGRWTVDVWRPLEGRTINAGIRVRFGKE